MELGILEYVKSAFATQEPVQQEVKKSFFEEVAQATIKRREDDRAKMLADAEYSVELAINSVKTSIISVANLSEGETKVRVYLGKDRHELISKLIDGTEEETSEYIGRRVSDSLGSEFLVEIKQNMYNYVICASWDLDNITSENGGYKNEIK